MLTNCHLDLDEKLHKIWIRIQEPYLKKVFRGQSVNHCSYVIIFQKASVSPYLWNRACRALFAADVVNRVINYSVFTNNLIPYVYRLPRPKFRLYSSSVMQQTCWVWKYSTSSSLWRHNGGDGVSNHRPHDCLFNRLFRRRSKKTSKLRVTGLCVGNSPGIGEFPAQMASNAENVSIWWRHHVNIWCRHQ